LLKKSSTIREGTEAERQALMVELEDVRIKLQEKEDALTQLEIALDQKEKELIIREERLDEMRSLIHRKDSVMNALRASVSAALLGFEGKGLTVEQRNGRVYVSMDAKLLFATGSSEVDSKGREAVINLARAIQNEKDLNIMVEGHTDTDSFDRTTFPRNNWDLSVLRATSVVSIMIENSQVNPAILTAAGRSQYLPVDPSNKAKNRRIEVILSPKLDDLMNLVNETQE
jgi:chemotaxis protein MotB